MIPEEEKTPGNSVNADESASSEKQQTPDYGTPSVQGSRKAAGRADSGQKNRTNGSPQQSTSAGTSDEHAPSPGTDANAPKAPSGEDKEKSGPYPGDTNPEKGAAGKNDSGARPQKADAGRKNEVAADAQGRFAHIPGWGIDASRENDPTYPIRKREASLKRKDKWSRPPVQPASVEILYSTERNSRPAVFGTPNPPKGLSGLLRRRAFRYSESDYRHWVPLMIADRVDVVEGVLGDLVHGRVPNPIAERGLKAEWKYNRKACIRKAAISVGVVSLAAAATILTWKQKRKTKGIFG